MEVYGCMLAWGGSGHYPGGSAGIVVSLDILTWVYKALFPNLQSTQNTRMASNFRRIIKAKCKVFNFGEKNEK